MPYFLCPCTLKYKREVGYAWALLTVTQAGTIAVTVGHSFAAEQTHSAMSLVGKFVQSEGSTLLRATSAGSASTCSFIGSPALLFYMNQRANCVAFPHVFSIMLNTSHTDVTKYELRTESILL